MNVATDLSQMTNIDNDASGVVEGWVDAAACQEAVQGHQDIQGSSVVPITVGEELTHTHTLHLGFFLVAHCSWNWDCDGVEIEQTNFQLTSIPPLFCDQ